jgi:type IV pilus assembly protein PilA
MKRSINSDRPNQKGFTLIEMLVVIAVMLVIVGIAAPAIVSSIQASNENAAAGTLKQVASAELGYRNLYNAYSPTAAALGGTSSATTCPSIPLATGACLLPDGLAKVLDAGTNQGYTYVYTLANGTWTMSATPSSSYAGRKAFFVDGSGAITYQNGITAMTTPGTSLGQ